MRIRSSDRVMEAGWGHPEWGGDQRDRTRRVHTGKVLLVLMKSSFLGGQDIHIQILIQLNEAQEVSD